MYVLIIYLLDFNAFAWFLFHQRKEAYFTRVSNYGHHNLILPNITDLPGVAENPERNIWLINGKKGRILKIS